MIDWVRRNIFAAMALSLLLLLVFLLTQYFSGSPVSFLALSLAGLTLFCLGLVTLLWNSYFFLLPKRNYWLLVIYIFFSFFILPVPISLRPFALAFLIAAGLSFLFMACQNLSGRSAPFMSALCFAGASLVFPPLCFLFVVLIYCYLRLGKHEWKDFVAFCSGAAIAYGLYMFFLWFTGASLRLFNEQWADTLLSVSFSFLPSRLSLTLLVLVIAFMVLVGFFRFLVRRNREKVAVLRMFESLYLTLFVLVLISALYGAHAAELLPVTAFPLAVLTVYYFTEGNRRRKNILPYVLMALALINYIEICMSL